MRVWDACQEVDSVSAVATGLEMNRKFEKYKLKLTQIGYRGRAPDFGFHWSCWGPGRGGEVERRHSQCRSVPDPHSGGVPGSPGWQRQQPAPGDPGFHSVRHQEQRWSSQDSCEWRIFHNLKYLRFYLIFVRSHVHFLLVSKTTILVAHHLKIESIEIEICKNIRRNYLIALAYKAGER